MPRPIRRVRRVAVATLALTSLAALSACGSHPDTAATGGAVDITLQDVDATVDLVCAQAADRGQAAPRSQLRTQVAALLASSELVRAFASERDLDVPDPRADSTVADRRTARRLGEVNALGAVFPDVLSRAAAQDLTAAGSPVNLADPTQRQAAVQLGLESFGRWLTTQHIDFDPRLRLDGSHLTPATGEAIAPVTFGSTDIGSVPISEAGRSSVAGAADQSAVQTLAPNQICGALARG